MRRAAMNKASKKSYRYLQGFFLARQGMFDDFLFSDQNLSRVGFLLFAMLFAAAGAFAQVPVIDHISPPAALVGSSGLTLLVTGSGFSSGYTVLWNGAALTTTFVSSTQLSATVPTGDLSAIGAAQVTVTGSTGTSNGIFFRILSPIGTVTSWTPTIFTAGVNTNITVYGVGFTSSAVIYFDWIPLSGSTGSTTFVSQSQLNGYIPNYDIGTSGQHSIIVVNGAVGAATKILTVSPRTVTFPNQVVGTTSSAQTDTVTNTGSATVTFASFTVGGVNASDFAISANTCGATLAASASCVVSLTVTPGALGARIGLLSVASDAVGSPISANLAGTGIAGSGSTVNINPLALNFGNVTSGSNATRTSVVTNSGGVGSPNYTITSMVLGGANYADFNISTSTCVTATPYAPGVACNINPVFTPSLISAEVATITVTDNSNSSPGVISLSGNGVALAPGANILPVSSMVFGNVQQSTTSAPITVNLVNGGTSSLTISSVVLGGTNSADFALIGGGCSSSTVLPPGQLCPLTATFTPSGTTTESAVITVTDNATGSPRTVALHGTGISTAHYMALTWTASNSPNLVGYNVYRGSQSGGPYALLTPAPINALAYTDSAVTHLATYFYVVTTVGTNPPYNPIESLNSSIVSGTIP
jgi:hypothetical protein